MEGERTILMNTAASSLATATSSASRAVQLGAVALLGLFVVGFVGFSHAEIVHNAGHDYRHSMAFPCH